MAGDWIKMRTDLHTHPKVVRMASALKADRLRIVGGLHSAWCLFDVHSVDGFLDGYSPDTLDDLIGFPGFAQAMIAVGWLEYEGENLVMPRFDAHNGQSAKRRAQDSDRKRNVRKVSASEADKKKTREEKRREDLKDKPHSSAYAREAAPPCPAAANPIIDNRPPPPGGMGADGKFTMYQGWRPDDDFLLKAAQWGTVMTEPPPETELAEFVTYWQAEGKAFHHVQWEQKFAQNLKRRSIQSKPGDNDGRIQQTTSTGGRAVEKIRAAIAAEREREGISPMGNDGGNVFGSMGGKERDNAIIDLESSDWRSE